jgi:hypothetical protein
MPPRTGRPWYEQSFVYLALIYLGVLSSLLVSAAGAAWLFTMPYQQALIVVVGAFVLMATYWKPWWFWDYYEAFVLRSLVGDRLTVWIYVCLGAALLYFGLTADLAAVLRK